MTTQQEAEKELFEFLGRMAFSLQQAQAELARRDAAAAEDEVEK
ncbi:MAG TPA: hypothetical protein VNN79_17885 [Actinomycetota bacterium]|nr:hypothetical protein [Actinomycetota bacterium]